MCASLQQKYINFERFYILREAEGTAVEMAAVMVVATVVMVESGLRERIERVD